MGHFSTFHASVRLDCVAAEDLIPADEFCPVCLFSGPRAVVLQIQALPTVNYLKCPSCGACSASAMPSSKFLADYYDKYYRETDSNVTIRNVERFARHIVNKIDIPSENDRLRILDFGGGDGSVAIAISEILLETNFVRKINIELIDFGEPRTISSEKISITKGKSLDVNPGAFDLVLASAVLEHVCFVHRTIKALFESVKPGGYFYARTPYVLPLRRIYPNFDLMFPIHVHDMGINFWDRILDTFGLPCTLVDSRPSIVESEFREDPF